MGSQKVLNLIWFGYIARLSKWEWEGRHPVIQIRNRRFLPLGIRDGNNQDPESEARKYLPGSYFQALSNKLFKFKISARDPWLSGADSDPYFRLKDPDQTPIFIDKDKNSNWNKEAVGN